MKMQIFLPQKLEDSSTYGPGESFYSPQTSVDDFLLIYATDSLTTL